MRAFGFDATLDHGGMRNWLSDGVSGGRGGNGPDGTGGRPPPCGRLPAAGVELLVLVVVGGADPKSSREDTLVRGVGADGPAAGAAGRAGGE